MAIWKSNSELASCYASFFDERDQNMREETARRALHEAVQKELQLLEEPFVRARFALPE